MSYNVALIVALAAPILVFAVLRINAALVFLSLCLGAVLVEYVAGEANSLVTLFSKDAGSVSASTIQLALLLAPAVVTAVVTVLSVHGKLKASINIFPAAAASALALLLAVPLMPLGVRFALEEEKLWEVLVQAQALIVGAGALISLAFLWAQRGGFKHPRKRGHKG